MKALVAFDGTEGSKVALQFGLKLRTLIDEYVIAYVLPSAVSSAAAVESYIPPSIIREQDQLSENIIAAAKEIVEPEGVQTSFLKLDASGEQIARVIVNAAIERGVSLIITGTRKLGGISRMILGSVSSEILKQSPIPVAVVPPKDEPK